MFALRFFNSLYYKIRVEDQNTFLRFLKESSLNECISVTPHYPTTGKKVSSKNIPIIQAKCGHKQLRLDVFMAVLMV